MAQARARKATLARKTKETDIKIDLDLDGSGSVRDRDRHSRSSIHMLESRSRKPRRSSICEMRGQAGDTAGRPPPHRRGRRDHARSGLSARRLGSAVGIRRFGQLRAADGGVEGRGLRSTSRTVPISSTWCELSNERSCRRLRRESDRGLRVRVLPQNAGNRSAHREAIRPQSPPRGRSHLQRDWPARCESPSSWTPGGGHPSVKGSL